MNRHEDKKYKFYADQAHCTSGIEALICIVAKTAETRDFARRCFDVSTGVRFKHKPSKVIPAYPSSQSDIFSEITNPGKCNHAIL